MKLLHVDASPKRELSNSRALARHFISCLRAKSVDLEIDYLDITVDTPPHTSEAFAIATYTPAENRTPAQKALLAPSDALCRRLLDAEALLFATPMYNFSIPSAFKAYIDAIVRTGITYVQAPDGAYVGQLKQTKVLFLTTRGADLRPGGPFAAYDALTPSLRCAFGFIGLTAPTFVDAQPLQFAAPAMREEALVRAKADLEVVAAQWASAA